MIKCQQHFWLSFSTWWKSVLYFPLFESL